MPKSILNLKLKDKKNNLRKVGSIEIKNQTEESADLYFFGDINSESLGEWQKYYPDDKAPQDVQNFLDQLENVTSIDVHINSGGGSVFGGIAIHNILKRFDAEITVYVEGLAASIASVIAMAGDKIIIPKNAQMMIHKPMSYTIGNADDFRKDAEVLDGCQKVILATYMDHVKEGVSEETINEMINKETWMNGEGWQEYFDIEVSESNKAVACSSEYYEKYNNLPDLQNKEENHIDPESIADAVVKRLEDYMDKGDDDTKEKDFEKRKAAILEDLDYI